MPHRYSISIDLGGTNLKIALVARDYAIHATNYITTNHFTNKALLIQGIVSAVETLIQNHALKRSDIAGIGLGLPGPIDIKKGLVHYFPNIPGWEEIPLRDILVKKTGLPCFLDNDANLMCLAEYTRGAAQNTCNAVCLTLGTGIGGGLIINGQPYHGLSFAAGELGHIPIATNGRKCNCGGNGCVEAYIGNRHITEKARKLFSTPITLEEISALAKKRNSLALSLWEWVGMNLGTMLVGVVNLLNPDIIVIGGGVAQAGEALLKSVRQTITKQAMPIQAAHVRVVKAKLGNNAGLIGAALLVRRAMR